MKTIITAILVAFCSIAAADDLPDLGEPSPGRYELSKGQIAAETAFVALMVIDYRQTMDINGWCERHIIGAGKATRNPNGSVTFKNGYSCKASEGNPFLGDAPSDVRIRNYFVGATLAHIAITKALPTEYRPYWIGAGIAVQLYTVLKNRQLGLQFSF